jgi:hypothetical protein
MNLIMIREGIFAPRYWNHDFRIQDPVSEILAITTLSILETDGTRKITGLEMSVPEGKGKRGYDE